MKYKLFAVSFLIFFNWAFSNGQIQQPAISWMKGFGGSRTDRVMTNVTDTKDGGFILALDSDSPHGTGNVDSFCSSNDYRIIFQKYNASATVLEWSKCFGTSGDSDLRYMFPCNNDETVLVGTYTPQVAAF